MVMEFPKRYVDGWFALRGGMFGGRGVEVSNFSMTHPSSSKANCHESAFKTQCAEAPLIKAWMAISFEFVAWRLAVHCLNQDG
jgi:hypothetical protein